MWLSEVGSWPAPVVVAQRVLVQTKNGPVAGVIGMRAIHPLSADERKAAPHVRKLWVDIGANHEEDARRLVRIGDPMVLDAPPVELLTAGCPRGRWTTASAPSSRSRPRAAPPPTDGLAAEIVLIGSVREEILYAAAAAAVDGQARPGRGASRSRTSRTSPTRAPAFRKGNDRALGSGPSISRGASTSPVLVSERMIATADEAGIAYTLEAEGSKTFTDAYALPSPASACPAPWCRCRCATCTPRPRPSSSRTSPTPPS